MAMKRLCNICGKPFQQSEKSRAVICNQCHNRKYRQSADGKRRVRDYNASEGGRSARERYATTEKGKAAAKQYARKRADAKLFKELCDLGVLE